MGKISNADRNRFFSEAGNIWRSKRNNNADETGNNENDILSSANNDIVESQSNSGSEESISDIQLTR